MYKVELQYLFYIPNRLRGGREGEERRERGREKKKGRGRSKMRKRERELSCNVVMQLLSPLVPFFVEFLTAKERE